MWDFPGPWKFVCGLDTCIRIAKNCPARGNLTVNELYYHPWKWFPSKSIQLQCTKESSFGYSSLHLGQTRSNATTWRHLHCTPENIGEDASQSVFLARKQLELLHVCPGGWDSIRSHPRSVSGQANSLTVNRVPVLYTDSWECRK